MTAIPGKWQITAKLSKNLGQYTIRVCHAEVAQPEVSPTPDLEEEVGDFVARYVLDKDSRFFEG
jgi:hypothetical protein